MKITKVIARQILDSRGTPTIESDVVIDDHFLGRSAVPSGASTGVHEAWELRDQDEKAYLGQGVLKAVSNVNSIISQKILGMDVVDQYELDQLLINLDGSENKSNLGANSILSVSLAYSRAVASAYNVQLFKHLSQFASEKARLKSDFRQGGFILPVPFMNVINGGKHAVDGVDFQEFMIVPHGFQSFSDALRAGATVFHCLKKILKQDRLITLVGDEGGFAPSFSRNDQPLEYLLKAIELAGYIAGKEISIALDPAVSELYSSESNTYNLNKEHKEFTGTELISYWQDLVNKYPIVSLEDGIEQDGWGDWYTLTTKIGSQVQIVGDDFLVTNVTRLQKAITENSCNAILIKLNQIGTLSETIDAVNLASQNDWNSMISHRSGETEDSYISDLVVGLGTGQIKTGSASRSDRVAKYNQLLRIEESLGSQAIYAGTMWVNGKIK